MRTEALALEDLIPWNNVRRTWRNKRSHWRRQVKGGEAVAEMALRLKVRRWRQRVGEGMGGGEGCWLCEWRVSTHAGA